MVVDKTPHRYLGNQSVMTTSLFFAVAVIAMVTADGMTSLQQWRREKPTQINTERLPRSVDECGGMYTTNYGQFTSPNYSMVYPNNVKCKYTISVTSGWLIWLQFVTMDMEQSSDCYADSLRIYKGKSDATEPLHNLCGLNLSLPAIKVNSSDVYIVFKSDSVGSGRGFKVEYFAFDESGAHQRDSYTMCQDNVAMAPSGVLLSHQGFPGNNYAEHAVCKLIIPTSGKYDGVKIEFFDVYLKVFSAGTCQEESETIVVYKMYHREHLEICRNEWRKVSVMVPGDDNFPVLLTFHTSQHRLAPYRGFKAIYTQYYADTKYMWEGSVGCKHGDFHCRNSQICIPESLVCDGYNHCGDFQDERNCGNDFLFSATRRCVQPRRVLLRRLRQIRISMYI
ncbi:cubilin-like [Saccoglossus kowalevskii]|uniref:Cubilin-like n=1 Tax=Saccoglossus kowalevskii TaxID=10224 RepID=A0ABM0M333_SACKO|nr:PREDICTED: cubilin-like [Saccoglossus kowalevskii]